MKPITLEDILRADRLVDELTPTEAATILTALAGVQLALANRILTAKLPEPPSKPEDSKMLNVDNVAALLNASRRTVYSLARRQDWLAFTVRLSRKHIRFREAGLMRWITQRASSNSWKSR